MGVLLYLPVSQFPYLPNEDNNNSPMLTGLLGQLQLLPAKRLGQSLALGNYSQSICYS